MEEVVIVGAGIAGLSCLNALVDHGICPLLIEAGTIGTPKICGEFLAPVASLQLEAWDIGPLQKISQIAIHANQEQLTIDFEAAAMSRQEAERALAKRAKARGAKIVENSPIVSLHYPHLELASGEKIEAKRLFVATGKFLQSASDFPYLGLKCHIPKSSEHYRLDMHILQGGYMGIVPVSESLTNAACLLKRGAQVDPSYNWMQAKVADFGSKKVPLWPHTYFIGDAIGSLPPAAGGGFTHAISSALLAVHYFLENDPAGYRKAIYAELHEKLPWAMGLHRIMLSPFFSKLAIKMLWPKAIKQLMTHIGLSYV